MPKIKNQELLTDIFGYWPSFHDAEIVTLLLDRRGDDGPFLETKIHLWEMTREVNELGKYVLTKHTLVTLRFTDVFAVSVKWFNNQNVLWGLAITEIDLDADDSAGRRYEVEMPESHGCEASFKCREVQVISVEPFEEPT